MNEPVLYAVRHEIWADLELMRFCGTLTPQQLAWTAPGTYGTVHATLQHLVRAQRGYLQRLTGEPSKEEWLHGAADVVPVPEKELLPLDELERHCRTVGERMEALLARPFDPKRVLTTRDDRVTAGIVLAQFIHHGSDHRAHVGTILGAHGVAPPELDVWAYGTAIGEND